MVRLVTFLGCIFCLVPIHIFGQSNENGKTVIVIDPGHGGTDSGAMGINGLREKDRVLKIAQEMVRIGERVFEESFEIYLTRNTDIVISLGDRAELARNLEADLFVSLHCNHSDNSRANGIEVFVPKQGKHLRESILLAYNLQKGIRENIGFKSRGVKFADFQVLRETVDTCPTVLLELGFLSDHDEAQHLTEDENILALALSILSDLKIK